MSTILIVEDDPAIREMVGMALTREGYDMLEAGSALEARQIIASRKPDLILLDWMLPGQSGFEFARLLHSNNAPPPARHHVDSTRPGDRQNSRARSRC